jgi:hypothetical protein
MIRYKILISILLAVIAGGIFAPVSFAQTPTYSCALSNDTLVSGNVYEFDVFLLRTGTTPMQLGGVQLGFTYNNEVKNGGTMTATWVPGSVDAAMVTSGQVNKNGNTATTGLIRVAAVLPLNGTGTGATISNTFPGTRIGRMRLINSIPFKSLNINLNWNFSSVFPNYPTKLSVYVSGIVGGINTDVTDPTQFFNKLANPTLPVELTSFVSNVSGREVNLTWETKTEVNTRQFEIDRTNLSTDGSTTTWSVVGLMRAAGTSVSPTKYSYTEKNLQAGKYQYRLKMIDNDGSYKYSDAIETEIALPRDFSISQNYPNPFNPSTKIDYQVPVEAKVILEVYSITGQKVIELVNQDQQAGYYSVNFGSSSGKLASGVYIYRIIATEKAGGNTFSSIRKMMLLK